MLVLVDVVVDKWDYDMSPCLFGRFTLRGTDTIPFLVLPRKQKVRILDFDMTSLWDLGY